MFSRHDGDCAAQQTSHTVDPSVSSTTQTDSAIITVTIGATVPTGFEHTAAEEVKEKIGADARISKDRGRIYFPVTSDKLFQVHLLRSVDNLFVVVDEYDHYQFKESKEETMMELQQLASKLPWNNALKVWELNRLFKKKKGHRKGANAIRAKPNSEVSNVATDQQALPQETSPAEEDAKTESAPDLESCQQDLEEATPEAKLIKFRVTCNRVGDKHSFSSNEAARDFGGAVQEFFQWKADMTKFDIEVLLNIHNEEVVIGIALTEESLHRRNISHFGPTTLRSTLCYGMLRLCKPQVSDVILDPMCGTGAIPLEEKDETSTPQRSCRGRELAPETITIKLVGPLCECAACGPEFVVALRTDEVLWMKDQTSHQGAIEFNSSFYVAGDNNDMAVKRTVNNICHIQRRRADKGSTPGLPIDTVQWDICNLPVRTSSVDIVITDMPFGKRMGSRKKNWELYPSCLREMARVCRPDTGKAVLLTQNKKCIAKAVSQVGGLWRKVLTVWVNVGGLHAGVYLLKRTSSLFGQAPEDVHEPRGTADAQMDEKNDQGLS